MEATNRTVYKYNNETYQEKLNELYNHQFTLISDFINARDNIIVRCNKCNTEFKIGCGSLSVNDTEKCPTCKINIRELEIQSMIQKLYDNVIIENVTRVGAEKYNVDCFCKMHNTKFKRLSKGIMYNQYKDRLLPCPKCQKERILDKKISRLKEKFPISLKNGYILDFICYGFSNNNLYVDMSDQFGYKYRFYQDQISSMCGQNYSYTPNRFFKRNPFTEENIKLFFKENDINLTIDDTINYKSGAREIYTFILNDGSKIKTSWNQIQSNPIQYCSNYEQIRLQNFERLHMTKEKAIPIIIRKQDEVGRPLIQSDFEGVNTSDNSIGIRVIWRIWGTFTKMIDDLGLLKHDTYFKPNSKNYMSHEEIMESIKTVCNYVKTDGREIVMYDDFGIFNLCVSKVRNHCKLDNTTLNKEIEKHNCKLQKAGNGMNHTFDDNEKVVSKYEYAFSNFLRTNGLIYGKTYFRNIYYRKLDEDYNGNMNCDYLLNINGNEVYIELAGILGNKEHMEAYRNGTTIKSKSKEEYKNKLYLKRDIFERNNLEYYILLPDEMNADNYKRILEKYTKKVA